MVKLCDQLHWMKSLSCHKISSKCDKEECPERQISATNNSCGASVASEQQHNQNLRTSRREKQERQNKKSSYVSWISKERGNQFCKFLQVVKALRPAWIGRLLSASDDKWKALPNYYFRKHGSLFFLLKCNYDIKLLRTGLPLFYRELQCFRDLKNATNIFPNGEFSLWKNKSIIIDNASLFWES